MQSIQHAENITKQIPDLHNGIFYPGKMGSLYWKGLLMSMVLTQEPYCIQVLWDHNTKFVVETKDILINDQIRSQIGTCHDSWAVMTCANWWTDYTIKIKTRGIRIFPHDFNYVLMNPLCHGSLAMSVSCQYPGLSIIPGLTSQMAQYCQLMLHYFSYREEFANEA